MKYKKSVFRSLAMVTQLGLCVLTPVLFAVLAGSYIDSRYGVRTTLVLLILGVLGGARGAYVMAKRLISREAGEDREERERRLRDAVENPLSAASRPKTPSRIRGAGQTGGTAAAAPERVSAEIADPKQVSAGAVPEHDGQASGRNKEGTP